VVRGGKGDQWRFYEEILVGGILMKKSNTIDEMNLRKLDLRGTPPPKVSPKDASSLGKFLHERNLIISDDYPEVQRARDRVEASGLVGMMMETCSTINRIAGENIVDMHSFLPPESILCSFIYVENGTDYFMRLEVEGSIPTLSFAERKCRDTYNIDFVRWVHRLADIEPVTINVKLIHEFQEIDASIEQVREWFKYLVSGLDRAYIPSF
jgi:hypothetical protein